MSLSIKQRYHRRVLRILISGYWCWSWNSNTSATWCEELTHWKRPWCWERLKAGGEGDDRGWEGWMASLTQWTWFWANSGRWWRTERPGVLQFMGLQRVEHNWATEQQRSQGLDRSLGGIISVRLFNRGLVLNSRNSKLHLAEIDYALGCRLKLNKLIRDWCINHIYFH